jgi:hypothetical protein
MYVDDWPLWRGKVRILWSGSKCARRPFVCRHPTARSWPLHLTVSYIYTSLHFIFKNIGLASKPNSPSGPGRIPTLGSHHTARTFGAHNLSPPVKCDDAVTEDYRESHSWAFDRLDLKFNNYMDRYKKIESKIEKIEENIKEMKEEMKEMKEDIKDIKKEMDKNEGRDQVTDAIWKLVKKLQQDLSNLPTYSARIAQHTSSLATNTTSTVARSMSIFATLRCKVCIIHLLFTIVTFKFTAEYFTDEFINLPAQSLRSLVATTQIFLCFYQHYYFRWFHFLFSYPHFYSQSSILAELMNPYRGAVTSHHQGCSTEPCPCLLFVYMYQCHVLLNHSMSPIYNTLKHLILHSRASTSLIIPKFLHKFYHNLHSC